MTKAWADANDQDGIRPSSVKAQLYADGTPLGDPVELSEADGWTHTWTGLFMKEAGKDVVYEVEEVSVPKGYEASVSGDATAGYTIAVLRTGGAKIFSGHLANRKLKTGVGPGTGLPHRHRRGEHHRTVAHLRCGFAGRHVEAAVR